MAYPIAALDGLDDDTVGMLKKLGIRTTEGLLEAAKDVRGRRALAEKLGVSDRQVLFWANRADTMRIPGMGKDFAGLVQAAGVDTVKELKHRNPKRLAEAIRKANADRKLVRVLPSDNAVGRWIENAKRLPPKISYR